ncbi:AraC family transcriptional regulator [Ramlibacter tataouinensis]|nr:AraC family transcriptional regulator [Ramlibacter tataouinensis]
MPALTLPDSPTAAADGPAPTPLARATAELAGAVQRVARHDGEHATAVAGLKLLRLSAPCAPVHAVHQPALCLIVQGAKQLMLADELYAYDASSYLVVAQDLPVMAQVVRASGQQPYLCVRLDFTAAELARCALEWSAAAAGAGAADRAAQEEGGRGLFVGAVDAALLDAVLRLVRLLETPRDIAALAPLVTREILYRLFAGPQGWRLAAMGHGASQASRIAHAIALLRERYADPLRIDDLARAAHMSGSSLHHHFKAVTAMSPLQYQKRLRLVEARRLMVGERLDAATAAYRVGYQSPSQFSREYARLFGAPPSRELRAWRERQA